MKGIQEGAAKINGFARAALDSCLDVVTWLAPEEGALAAPADGVRECVGLVATGLGFRGYAVRNEVTALDGQVRRAALRNVLTAVLVHATDKAPAPAQLVLTGAAPPAALELRLAVGPAQGERGFAAEAGYRLIEWADVEALAQAESVAVSREGQTFVIMVPWARPQPA
jgi:hypothetical protein